MIADMAIINTALRLRRRSTIFSPISKFQFTEYSHHQYKVMMMRIFASTTTNTLKLRVFTNSILQPSRRLITSGTINNINNNNNNNHNNHNINNNVIDDANEEHLLTPVDRFPISPQSQGLLKSIGISGLFPIQTATFQPIFDGKDVVGKAKTGTGKTMAFVLPIIERLIAAADNLERNTDGPRVLILCPTRELAKQVQGEVQRLSPRRLSSVCVYGGVGYGPQVDAIRKGADVVVGTPGRVLDLVKAEKLSLVNLQTLCLDEADHMLDVGFEKEMSSIIEAIRQHQDLHSADELSRHQTLLFSATMPRWVRKVQQQYLRPGDQQVFIDLVGSGESQSVQNIRYLAVGAGERHQLAVLADLLQLYGSDTGTDKSSAAADSSSGDTGGGGGGDAFNQQRARCLVFADTKAKVEEIVAKIQPYNRCAALHGDISQFAREQTMNAFRKGQVDCLVATDVAARGLDVPNVELVVQCGLPERVESFLHRSGRTARAGKSGICISLYDPRSKDDLQRLQRIEQHSKIEFEQTAAPQRDKIMRNAVELMIKRSTIANHNKISAEDYEDSNGGLDPELLNSLRPHASKLLAEFKGNAEIAISALLATATGAAFLTDRSAITGQPDRSTVKITPLKQQSPHQQQQSANQMPDKQTMLTLLQRAVPNCRIDSGSVWSFADPNDIYSVNERRAGVGGGFFVDVPTEWRSRLIDRLSGKYQCDTEFEQLPRLFTAHNEYSDKRQFGDGRHRKSEKNNSHQGRPFGDRWRSRQRVDSTTRDFPKKSFKSNSSDNYNSRRNSGK